MLKSISGAVLLVAVLSVSPRAADGQQAQVGGDNAARPAPGAQVAPGVLANVSKGMPRDKRAVAQQRERLIQAMRASAERRAAAARAGRGSGEAGQGTPE